MVYELKHYQELSEGMIKYDKKKELNNKEYDKMDHVDWSPPPKLMELQGFRAAPSTDPHDAIRTGTSVLSAQDERITLQPLAANPETKQKANENERALKWLMDQVNQRRQGTVQKSVVRSSLKYDEVVAQVIDLDYQIENKEIFGGDTKREKAARRYGRFVVNTYHPNDVHVLYSGYMPEAVLLVQKRKAKDVMNEWGKLASKLKKLAEDDAEVTYYDYMDYDDHVVWCTGDRDDEMVCEIMKEEHEMPFLPWACRVGGDTMEHAAEHRRRPLLYSIMQADSWHTQNVARSLLISEVMFYAMAPRTKEETPLGSPTVESTTVIDHNSPGRTINVTPGHTLDQMQPPGLDPSLREIGAMLQAEMAKSTLANVLQGGDVAPGEAFASLNLRTQTAVGSLKPAKELSEFALADIYTLFLLYANYTKNDIKGYGTEKANLGEEYVIRHNEIDPEAIYLSVELTPDVPLDRQQKANTASMALQSGILSKERAMEDMGITDPDQVTEEIYMEQMMEARITDIVQTIMAQGQLAIQQQQMAMQQQQQMGMQAMQNQGANVPGGNGFNPAMGGQVPASVVPGATREGVTGEDRMGNEAPSGMGGMV